MKDLEQIRSEIAEVDAEMAGLFIKRMELCAEVAQFKTGRGLPVYVPEVESAKIEETANVISDPVIKDAFIRFQKNVMKEARKYEEYIIKNNKL